jgi:hypothetical protein
VNGLIPGAKGKPAVLAVVAVVDAVVVVVGGVVD